MKEENKFNKGDIVYEVSVNKHLIININKVIVDSFFFNKKYIYHFVGLGNDVIREFEIKETEEEKNKNKNNITSSINDERNPRMTISGSAIESCFCLKEDLEKTIQNELKNRINQNKRIEDEIEKFRCPITDGKIIKQQNGFTHVLDGPTTYIVEGSDIIWRKYPMDFNPRPYHTEYNGKKYSFEYLGNGNWRELFLIKGEIGRGIYVDKNLYESGDEKTIKDIDCFLCEQKIEKEKSRKNKIKADFDLIKFPLTKKIESKTTKVELVKVQPMSSSTGLLDFGDPKRDVVVIRIDGEECEIYAEDFNSWNLKAVKSGFMFGKTFIEKIK